MATLERGLEGEKQNADEEKQQELAVKVIEPVPLSLLYPSQEETYTDPDFILSKLPPISDSVLKESVKTEHAAPPLPPRSPVLAEKEQTAGAITEANQEISAGNQEVNPVLLPEKESFDVHNELQRVRGSLILTPEPKNELMYPSFTQESTVHTTEVNDTVLEKSSPRLLVSDVVFEPYINKSLNRILSASAEADFHDLSEHPFRHLVQKYRDAEVALERALSTVQLAAHEAKIKQTGVWVKKIGSAEQTQALRTGVGTVKAQVSFLHAQYSRKKAKKLEEELASLIEERSGPETFASFHKVMSAFAVEQELLGVLAQLEAQVGTKVVGVNSNAAETHADPTQGPTVGSITARDVFSILAAFEKDNSERIAEKDDTSHQWRLRFKQALKTWILHVGGALLNTGKAEDRAFLARHVSKWPGVGSETSRWVLGLLQVLPNRSMQTYETSTVETEDALCILKVVFPDTFPADCAQSSGSPVLSEVDTVALVEQCSLTEVLDSLVSTTPKGLNEARETLGRIEFALDLLQTSLRQQADFPQVSQILAQSMCRLITKLAKLLQTPQEWSSQSPTETKLFLDRICLSATQTLSSRSDKKLWLLLDALPLAELSQRASWVLTLFLVLNIQSPIAGVPTEALCTDSSNEPLREPLVETDFAEFHVCSRKEVPPLPVEQEDVEGVFYHLAGKVDSVSKWFSLAVYYPCVRQQLSSVLGGTESDTVHHAMSLTTLARNSSLELASVIVFELLNAILLSPAVSEDLARPIRSLIASVCEVHPSVIGLLLKSLDTLEGELFSNVGKPLVLVIPFHLWKPSSHDVDRLGVWLRETERATCSLAMDIIDALNFGLSEAGAQIDEQSPHLSPDLNLQVARVISTAQLEMSQRSFAQKSTSGTMAAFRRWVPLTNEFRQDREMTEFTGWCWHALLRLSTRHQKTFATYASTSTIHLHQLSHAWMTEIALAAKLAITEVISKEASLNPLLAFAVLDLGILSCTDMREAEEVAFKTLMYFADSTNGYKFNALAAQGLMRVMFFTLPARLASQGPIVETHMDFYDRELWVGPLLRTALLSRTLLQEITTRLFFSALKREDPVLASFGLGDLISAQLSLLDISAATACAKFWARALLFCCDWGTDEKRIEALDQLFRAAWAKDTLLRDSFILNELEMSLKDDAEQVSADMETTKTLTGSLLNTPQSASVLGSALFGKSDTTLSWSSFGWISFHTTLAETFRELPLWRAAGEFLVNPKYKDTEIDQLRAGLAEWLGEHLSPSKPQHFLHTNFRQLSSYRIYTWAYRALEVPRDHPLLPLFWQMFLTLYFCRAASGEVFGYRFLFRPKKQTRRADLRVRLETRAREVADYFSEISRANSGLKIRQQENSEPSRLAQVAEFFRAVSLWLRHPEPSLLVSRPMDFGEEYCIARLLSASRPNLLSQLSARHCSEDLAGFKRHLWLDLVDLESVGRRVALQALLWVPVERSSQLGPQTPSKPIGKVITSDLNTLLSFASQTPPPVYVSRAPVVSLHIDLEALEPVKVLQPLAEHSQVHAERTQKLQEHVHSIVQILPQLYKRRTQHEVVTKPSPNSKDKEPYKFEITYEESVVDKTVQHQIEESWGACDDHTFGWYERDNVVTKTATMLNVAPKEIELCVAIMTTQAILDELGKRTKGESSSESQEWAIKSKDIGIRWFRALLQLEDRKTRKFPPAQRLLWSSIAKTGLWFAKGSPSETRFTLTSMLEDPNRVHLLAQIFNPNVDVKQVLNLYSTVWEFLPQLDAAEALPILRTFDFQSWLARRPELETRVGLLSMVGQTLRHLGWRREAHNTFQYHCELFLEICKRDFSDHFDQILHLLVGTHVPVPAIAVGEDLPAHNKVWDLFFSVPDQCWTTLTTTQLVAACTDLGRLFENLAVHVPCNTESGTHLGQVGAWKHPGLLDNLFELTTRIVGLLCVHVEADDADQGTSSKKGRVREAWSAITSLFLGWLFASPVFSGGSVSSNRGIVDLVTDMVTRGIAVLTSSFCALLEASQSEMRQWVLDQVCDLFFSSALAGTDGSLARSLSRRLLAIPHWKSWFLSPEKLELCWHVISAEDSSPVSQGFVEGILLMLDWALTERHLCEEAAEQLTDFYTKLLDVFIRLLRKQDIPLSPSVRMFFENSENLFCWDLVAPRQYNKLLEDYCLQQEQAERSVSKNGLEPSLGRERQRCVVVLRFFGQATGLSSNRLEASVRQGGTDTPKLREAINREISFVRVLTGFLGKLQTQQAASEGSAKANPHGTSKDESEQEELSHIEAEASRLPIPPRDLLHLLYGSLCRVANMAASFQSLFSHMEEFGEFILELLRPLLITNTPICSKDQVPEASNGSNNTLLKKIESMLLAIPLASTLYQSGVTSNSEEQNPGNIVKSQASEDVAELEPWEELWPRVLQAMLAASTCVAPFDSREETAPLVRPDRRIASGSVPLGHGVPTTTREPGASSRNISRFVDGGEAPSKGLSVTLAGYGLVLQNFLSSRSGSTSFLVIDSVFQTLAPQPTRLIEALEACAIGAFRFDIRVLVLCCGKWLTALPGDSLHVMKELQARAAVRGAWHALYILFLTQLHLELAAKEFVLSQIGQVMSLCATVEAGSGSFFRPAPHSILPLLLLFFELCNASHAMPAKRKSELLRSVIDAVQSLARDRATGIGSLASAVMSRISSAIQGSSVPAYNQNAASEAPVAETLHCELENNEEESFRLLSRAVVAFVSLNSRRSTGSVRYDISEPLNSSSSNSQAAMASLTLPAGDLQPVASMAVAFCGNSGHTLANARELVELLTRQLFPHCASIRRPIAEWRKIAVPETTVRVVTL